jgi:hypothetical protein
VGLLGRKLGHWGPTLEGDIETLAPSLPFALLPLPRALAMLVFLAIGLEVTGATDHRLTSLKS